MKIIKKFKLIIWDFDGVIKDSVAIKLVAFKQLFQPYGNKIVNKVQKHHKKNEGLSRFIKIPLYLSWINEDLSKRNINKFCNKYSKIVFNEVIASPWVPGVKKFLETNPYNQIFTLISATPEKELKKIISKLEIKKCFKSVYGSPRLKSNLIKIILKRYNINSEEALMFGDTGNDYIAAKNNKVYFIFRKTQFNGKIIKKHKEKFVQNFNNIV